jgi:SAM-dependent methyltransferase
MGSSETSQSQPPASFPTEWYQAAPDDHFWMVWRLNVILRHLGRLKLDSNAALKGLDIGCGHGAVQRQLHTATAWIIDGCDANEAAIALNRGHSGTAFLYDIFAFRPDLKEKYDLVFLLDVIEHIGKPIGFLTAAAFYLRRGGFIIINVPAIPTLYSRYDVVAGHVRRYTKRSLQSEIAAAGLEIATTAYWGLSLIPLVALRKATSTLTRGEAVIRRGFVPPSIFVDKLLRRVMSAELSLARDVPWGTSLLAIARKE